MHYCDDSYCKSLKEGDNLEEIGMALNHNRHTQLLAGVSYIEMSAHSAVMIW